ncbi:hypothetical protein ITI46_04845 [Streptomyces oryzae]|uniref:Uncharacterized protein n=1 Tax=Streptomyces oryzae TaxID=1434886 RepID=A0ABS3X6M3_9ACTN|nr:hypothetical protein [Streptomyces oryzae]MBO8191027.1 hypothetical protein [Streptomyces oryzae]
MQPRSVGVPSRRSASAFLTFLWGALLLVAGIGAAAAPVQASAPSSVIVTADRGAHHSGEARLTGSRPDVRRKTAVHGATATAPHEALLPGHPVHPPAVPTAAPGTASEPLVGRFADGPPQERAPPRSAYDPRTSRGPPSAPLDV